MDQPPSKSCDKGCWSILRKRDGLHVPSVPSASYPCGVLPQPTHKPAFKLTAITGGEPQFSPPLPSSWVCIVSGWGIRASKKITCSSSNNTQWLLY